MNDEINVVVIRHDSGIDADTSGHLATALFIAVIAMLLVLIYALATAA